MGQVACPRRELHTEAPAGYLAYAAWADEMSKTHRQRRCPGCGLWSIWEPIRCEHCGDGGIVCENHPDRPWDGECCGGAGMPCPACCSEIPRDGTRSIVEAFVPDADRTR